MTDKQVQVSFLEWVRDQVEPVSGRLLVEDLCDIMSVSKDSAYRRMRGDSLMTFNEVRKIAIHFGLSLDMFLQVPNQSVLFQKRRVDATCSYKDFLQAVLENLSHLSVEKGHRMVYIAKDIPPFHFFQFPKLSYFKSFFWQKTIIKVPHLRDKPYGDLIDEGLGALPRLIWEKYLRIPCLEIWSDETINVTLRQMAYYYEGGIISREEVGELLGELHELVSHLKNEAEKGCKYNLHEAVHPESGAFELYYNEIEIGDNTVFFHMGEEKMVLKTYNLFNLLATQDHFFCAEIGGYINNILEKSVPLSQSSEKERNRFFSKMTAKVKVFEGQYT